MTELRIEELGRTPVHRIELWGDPAPAAKRIATALGHPLPRAGRAEGAVLRVAPAAWWLTGDPAPVAKVLGEDGAITAIGGGLVQARIAGDGWRALLMEGGLFDAEGAGFGPDSVATTLIEHVTVTLRVESAGACLAHVPASLADDLLGFWRTLISAGGVLR